MLVSFMSRPSLPSQKRTNVVSGLGQGFSTAPKSLSGVDVSLAFVIPYLDADVDRLVTAMCAWKDVGDACLSPKNGKVGLFFYNNLVDTPEKRHMEPLVEQLKRESPAMAAVFDCFTEVHTIYADLKPDEDDYPEGPSVMFFNLLLQERLRDDDLAGYTDVMWMEWDLRPVRPLWVDAVFDAASPGPEGFWVRGSYYYGKGLDAATLNSHNRNWVGHINGNALYTLRDRDFHTFLELVREREPPTDYWRPFDVAMWKVLHDFSYSWRIYQTYRAKFQQAAFVRSVECIAQTDRQFLVDRSYLAHESSPLAKKNHYFRKFAEKGGHPLSNNTLHGEEVRPDVHLSVFLAVLARENFESASLVLKRAQAYIPHALEYVVVVLESEATDAAAAFPEFVKVHTLPTNIHASNVQQSFMNLRADEFCRGRHILHLDVDVAILRTVYYKDLFLLGKTIVEYTLYDEIQGHLGQVAQNVAKHVFGHAVTREYSQASSRHVYTREVYTIARQHLQERFRAPSFEIALQALEKLPVSASFDDLNFLGIILEFKLPEHVSFVHRGPTFDPTYDKPVQSSAFMYPYRELSVPSPFCALDRHFLRQDENISYGLQKQRRLSILRNVEIGESFACA